MIKVEYVLTREDGVEIHRHFSNDHRYIIQQETGIIYESAEDTMPCKYTYIEGDYFEWYIDEQISLNYPDEKIEAAISGNTKTYTETLIAADLEKTDSEIIS